MASIFIFLRCSVVHVKEKHDKTTTKNDLFLCLTLMSLMIRMTLINFYTGIYLVIQKVYKIYLLKKMF